ncbi:MAG: hypothetical protein WCX73_06100 [Candidatus Pacearchaeota archaeon]
MINKVKFIDLEEGIILMGYNISIEEAVKKMRRHQAKEWGIKGDELLTEIELEPIYQLITKEQDYEESYSWKTKPQVQADRIIGWVFQI